MIVFFYGEEDFLIDLEVKKLREKFFNQSSGGDLNVFDFDLEINLGNLIENLSEQNLFSAKKMIIINNFFSNTKADEQNELLEILKNNDFSEDILIFSEVNQPRKNTKLFKWLEKNSDKNKEFKKLEVSKIVNWIKKRILEISNEVLINDRVAKEIILMTGADLRKIDSNLNKLVNYVFSGEIKSDDLQKLVNSKIEADIFKTIEFLFQKNKNEALLLLNKQIAKGDDPFYVFSMYVYQIRVLLKISGFVEKEKIFDNFIISKQVKLNPFVVKKSLSLIKNFSLNNLIKAHHFLLHLDKEVKLGRIDILTALELFVLKI